MKKMWALAGCCLQFVAGLAVLSAATAPLAADIGRWSPLGPYGGSAASLAVDPLHSSVVYAVTGPISKSIDGGATWSLISHGLPPDFSPGPLAIDPLRPTTLYLGAGVLGFGVFKSVDGGASWTPPGPGLEGQPGVITSLAVDPRHSGTVYAGTATGINKTIDGGATWAPAQNGIPGGFSVIALAIAPSSPRTLYAATGVGNAAIYKTTDGGRSWALAAPGPVATTLAVEPSNSAIVYAGTGGGAFKSTDGGRTWKPSGHGVPSFAVTALAIVPSTPRILYAATDGGLYKSSDAGARWTPVQGPWDPPIFSLAIDPTAASTLYVSASSQPGSTVGVWKSVDGGASWAPSFQGLDGLGISSFAIDPLAPATLYAQIDLGPLLTSVDGGATWSAASGLTGGIGSLVQDPSTPSTLYATGSACGGSPALGLCRSLDGGTTWSPIATPEYPNALAVDPSISADLYLASNAGLWRSTDRGATWTAATGDIAQAGLFGIATDPNSPGTLYVFGQNPYLPQEMPKPRLYKSVDRGLTWTQIQGGLASGPSPIFVGALAIDPATSVIYAETGAGIEKSVDGGSTWSVIYQPADPVHSDLGALVLAPGRTGATVYVSHAGGLLTSSDGGATWQTITPPGLPGRVKLLAVDPQNPQHLVAAASGGGLWSLTRAAPVPCVPGPTALCLGGGGGRFKVEAAWATGQASGAGQSVSLTPDTGAFSFFAASNLELLVKVLDGCALNANHWVFAGGLTDVQVTLRVTDSQSGNVEIYTNPGGIPFPPLQDTGAFPTCP
ncbi:MAG TPA: hypothetical protein VHB47_16825 [Thermoanaerobaculia bacterium]|jgi:photosystem II stability/assembly factor-like uncharacterized protein|nr:hypothetical protein [Thermoanaerobaculia bacterium]